jgi:hypothetical protein
MSLLTIMQILNEVHQPVVQYIRGALLTLERFVLELAHVAAPFIIVRDSEL